MMEYFVSALTQVVQPLNLAVILLGTIVGILAGAMPGLSSIMALTIVTRLPFPWAAIQVSLCCSACSVARSTAVRSPLS